MTRPLALIGLLLGAFALTLQFSLSIPSFMANGASFGRAVLHFVSFLTIVTNTALTLVYLSALTSWPVLDPLRRPVARATAVSVVLLVFLYYHFVLGPTKSHESLWYLANLLLHYVLPLFHVTWWVLAQQHGQLRWHDLPIMALVPLAYLPYALGLGSFIGSYPYPILELNRLSFLEVMANAGQVAVGLALLCVFIILADRTLPPSTVRVHSTKPDA
jgi:hypothetical protein